MSDTLGEGTTLNVFMILVKRESDETTPIVGQEHWQTDFKQ